MSKGYDSLKEQLFGPDSTGIGQQPCFLATQLQEVDQGVALPQAQIYEAGVVGISA